MPFADYPSPPGNKLNSIHTITGPVSYTAVTNGAAPSGGQVVTAREVGMVAIEWAGGTCSATGAWVPLVIFDGNPNKAMQSIRVRWIVAATGAEVAGGVDLSTAKARMLFIGQ